MDVVPNQTHPGSDPSLLHALSSKGRKRDRTKRFLSSALLRNAYDGVRYANHIGKPFNVYLTIAWKELGWRDDGHIRERQQAFLDEGRQWCGRNGVDPIFLYVWERSEGMGLHSHMMWHVPMVLPNASAIQKRRLPGKAVSSMGPNRFGVWAKGAVDKQDLLRDRRETSKQPWVDVRPGERDRLHQFFQLRYYMKGFDPALACRDKATGRMVKLADRLELKLEAQGPIPFQRLGMCHALGPAARKADPTFVPLTEDVTQWSSSLWFKEHLETYRPPKPTEAELRRLADQENADEYDRIKRMLREGKSEVY